MQKDRKYTILIPLFSIILGFLFGGIMMAVSGYDPIEGIQKLVSGAFGKPFNIGQTVRAMTPLILIALGFSLAYKAGFFNIGLAGQAMCGWLASVTTALAFPDLPKFILLPLCILVGALAGALWAGIAGVLKAFFNTSEVIVTIMLNYVSVYLNDYIIWNFLTNPSKDSTAIISPNASLRIPELTKLTKNSTIHGGIFIAIVAAIVVFIIFKKTTLGFELKSVGYNPFAAEYAGMNAKKNIIIAMLMSGALAGLGGVMEGLGQFQNIFQHQGAAPSIGFRGMSVALLASGNPIAIIFSALLFAIFEVGGTTLSTDIPVEVVDIISAIIIFFVGAGYLIRVTLNGTGKTIGSLMKSEKEAAE